MNAIQRDRFCRRMRMATKVATVATWIWLILDSSIGLHPERLLLWLLWILSMVVAERIVRPDATELVDDLIDEWNVTPTGVNPPELHEYLGMTWAEYAAFVRHPSNLPADWHERAKGKRT